MIISKNNFLIKHPPNKVYPYFTIIRSEGTGAAIYGVSKKLPGICSSNSTYPAALSLREI